ncbi:P-loop containing nucleoside triphosphate hydrolase protein, partial [Multifurca ochricompacta]
MQSNSLTKKFRRMFHASQRSSQPVPIHSSEPIGGSVDVAMTTIETSLAALKEASSLMAKIPYISPVAGLLLQVLTMRDEIKQNKEEWGVVMRKLGRVASLVVNVGESCQKYNLEENDLPPGLRSILRSLQNELNGIESLLKQSAEIGYIRKALLRKDLLRKVKQYDGELSNVLQTFQAELALDARFEQIAERRKGIPAGPSGPSNVITFIPQEPRSPQIFFGRDAELAEIVHMILTGIRGSRPARIAILGPGGYGKTTLVNAALTHPQVQEQFGGARYFVACESVFSSGALLVELAKTLGILDGGSDASWSHIHAALSSKDSIICLDNFESPWDQAGDMRDSVEELLSRVTALNSVTLLITMRGTMRPGQTLWTKPTLAPLKTLSQDAAREIWEEIEQNYDAAAEELIKAVDYVPLAVSLLAHLAQATSPALLLKEWNQNQTKFIQMGQTHRLSNLEYSIQLSIDSGRMRANPPAKDLLGILSMLPDGIHTEQLGRFEEILVDMDILSNLRTLQQCSLVHVIGERYQTHPIIRHFCNQQEVISSKYKDLLQDFYINLASSNSSEAQPKYHAEMVLEMNNTKAILFDLLRSNYGNNSKLVEAIITFTKFHGGIGDHSDKLISQTVETLQQRPSDTSVLIRCLQAWGRLYYYASDIENAKAKMQEMERLCSSSPYNNGSLHAEVLRDLSEVYKLEGALNEAEVSCQKALELHKIANSVLGQANDHSGLGDMYLRLS